MAAFEHSLSLILLTWLLPSHLRLYSSICPHGQRFIHPHGTQGTSAQTCLAPCWSHHPSAPSRCTQQHQAQGPHVHAHPYPRHFLPWSTTQHIQSQQLARHCLNKQILKITEPLGTYSLHYAGNWISSATIQRPRGEMYGVSKGKGNSRPGKPLGSVLLSTVQGPSR